ncbi:hypothetical protein IEQ_04712 [Bacillus cereus BAG6X1-2]|nr:hypothetical protein IEQ_04712 [Bacillus cereus BAG6X1-2]
MTLESLKKFLTILFVICFFVLLFLQCLMLHII